MGGIVQLFIFHNKEITIPAILVGEEGRGRRLGVLPVSGLTPEEMNELDEKGNVIIFDGEIGETHSGRPKLIAHENKTENECIIVLRGHIGFRGSNDITISEGVKEILSGVIAQGAAGAMGSGGQWILKCRFGSTIKMTVGGRLYGAPSEYIYKISSDGVLALTGEENDLLD
ncbi:MAG TPA: hypothetical protein PK119_00790 [Candidatus Paceibacterota bacterium]|nr:hypothetical protein [Candidatus Paceibacterota bacterium]